MGMDLSYLEALMGGAAADTGGETGGVWVVSPDGAAGDGIMRLVGKARVVADALGTYVYLLLAGGANVETGERAVKAGADRVLLAEGRPSLTDLADYFRERAPQVILFPGTQLGRTLGPGVAQRLDGGLCGYAADLEVDPVYQRIVAHQPVLEDAARQRVTIVATPAVAVIDTGALPAAFNEPWRSGSVEDAGVSWGQPVTYPPVDLPAPTVSFTNPAVVVAAGRGLRTADGFALAARLAEALGGVVAGDIGALDAGWITEAQLLGLTGRQVAPKFLLTLGIDGDTSLFMSVRDAGLIVAVQPDPTAPIAPMADTNIHHDPVEFAAALLDKLNA
jgi:electron transfer flavoprotein alpha subunit